MESIINRAFYSKKKHSHAWLVINSKHEYAKVDFGMLLKKKICELRQNLYFRMRPTEHNGARHRCVSVCDNFNYKIMNVIKEVKISSYNLTGAIKVYVSNNKPLRLLSFPHWSLELISRQCNIYYLHYKAIQHESNSSGTLKQAYWQ